MGENTSLLPGKFFFEYIPDIALIVKPDGQIVEANPAACAAYGYDREELLNMDIFKLTPAYLHGLLLESFKKAKKGGALVEMLQQNREGQDIPVEINLQPVRYQEQLYYLCSIRNISHLLKSCPKGPFELADLCSPIYSCITDGL